MSAVGGTGAAPSRYFLDDTAIVPPVVCNNDSPSSTVAGQLVDTTVLILIAFGGRESWGTMLNLIIFGYIGKVLYEAAATPVTYLIVNKLKRSEGVDVYDRDTNLNPFARNPGERAER
jgi:hypothetical protein